MANFEENEIKRIFAEGEKYLNDYRLYVYEGNVYKVANKDVSALVTLISNMYRNSEVEIKKEFDDFTYHPKVNPKNGPEEYATQEVFDKISKIVADVKPTIPNVINDGITLENRLAVKNVVDLGENIKRWIEIDKRRIENMRKYLSSKIKKNYSSLIGTTQYVEEGTELYEYDHDSKILGMLDKKELCNIIGVKYLYDYGSKKMIFSKMISENVEIVKEAEHNFKENNVDAFIDRIIINKDNNVFMIKPECLMLTDQNVMKKGV